MAKRLQEYVKYTKTELDSYTTTTGSCVYKINTNLHFALRPYVLTDLKTALPAYLLKHKVGYYDSKLDGVILSIRNIKVLNGVGALRADDPLLHIDINADCYIFKPEEGAVLTGITKHVGKHHVGVIIYRVFNVVIRVEETINKQDVKVDQPLQFQIKNLNFNLKSMHPYIEGELLSVKQEKEPENSNKAKITRFESDEEDEIVTGKHENISTPDSGIGAKEDNDRNMELNDLLAMIKNEPLSGGEDELETSQPIVQTKKRKRKTTQNLNDSEPASIVQNDGSEGKKKRRKHTESGENDNSIETEIKVEKSKIKKEELE